MYYKILSKKRGWLMFLVAIILSLSYLTLFSSTKGKDELRQKAEKLNIKLNSTQNSSTLSSSVSQEQLSLEITNLQNTITNFGALGEPSGTLPSSEWVANSDNHYAFTGDLWVGAILPDGSVGVTTTNIYGLIGPSEWVPEKRISNNNSTQVHITTTKYNDLDETISGHISLGLEVEQKTFAFAGDDFIRHELRIKNLGTKGRLTDIFVAIFYDFDISSSAHGTYWADDMAAYDANNNISYMSDGDDPNRLGDDTGENGISTGYVGIKILNQQPYNNLILFPGSGAIQFLTDQQRYTLLSTQQFDSQVNQPRDYSILHTAGPFTLKKGNSISFDFVHGIGEGLNGLIETMDQALTPGRNLTVAEIGNQRETETLLKNTPEGYDLLQNFPNPFNPETEISFQLAEARHVVIKIYNIRGEEIRTLVDTFYEAGDHKTRWDAKDNNGNAVPSGIYLYQLKAGSISQVKKMTLIR